MLHLPIMVAAGGINSAGRSSHRHAYKRMVLDALPQHQRETTRRALAQLMGTSSAEEQDMGTLIRGIEAGYFDPSAIPWARRVTSQSALSADMAVTQVLDTLPAEWSPVTTEGRRVGVSIPPGSELLLPGSRRFEVSAAGQLPTGFSPGALYGSRNHPRGLQMTVYAASDALADLGIAWSDVESRVGPEGISVYVSSSMGQLDEDGTGGMLRGRAMGKRVTSKQCPLGFAEMPGDFINAYVLRSMGSTGPAVGACATFLYNLRLAVNDIRSGRARVAVVGAAEAPILSEVMEGYAAMGALATDQGLRTLDGLGEGVSPDFRRACRPFGDNCGFTMAESAQVVVLFDDSLALELGAPLLAAVPDVFVHADGAKKSVSGPGVGNFITMARAVSTLDSILGAERLRRGGMVQAHGTGTPQNRVTESEILDRVAGAFGIDNWPVFAIKSFIGHSLGAAGGDQLSATLGIWETGLLPGINTIDAIAGDVHANHLSFATSTEQGRIADYAVINSKGFGGNNASAALLSPDTTSQLLEKHHGKSVLAAWQREHDKVDRQRQDTESERLAGRWAPSYYFNDGVLGGDDIVIDSTKITLGDRQVSLAVDLPTGWTLD